MFLFLVCCSPVLAASFPEWCVLPPTVHCSQNETCKTFGNITASEIVWHAMRGEEEGKQLLFDFQSWPAEYNLTSSLSVIPGDLVLEGRSKLKISGTNISWWQVGYVYCKHNIRYKYLQHVWIWGVGGHCESGNPETRDGKCKTESTGK